MTNNIEKTAIEKGIAEMIKPLAKNVAPEHRGIRELLMEVEDMLDESLTTVRLALKRIDDFNDLQNRFYKGGKP